jgi:hypothetical protein
VQASDVGHSGGKLRVACTNGDSDQKILAACEARMAGKSPAGGSHCSGFIDLLQVEFGDQTIGDGAA